MAVKGQGGWSRQDLGLALEVTLKFKFSNLIFIQEAKVWIWNVMGRPSLQVLVGLVEMY
jgi:hypothetical protein